VVRLGHAGYFRKVLFNIVKFFRIRGVTDGPTLPSPTRGRARVRGLAP